MRQRWRGKHCLQAVNEDFESAVEHFFNFRDFVLLLGAREADVELAVEHFFNFGDFCSTFGGARGGFGVGGRIFFQFLGILFYFRGRARRILSQR